VELDSLLRAHAFMRVERPPLLWELDAQDEPLLRMLGEMIATGLGRGNELGELTLNVSNVTVEPGDEEWIPAGDYVALTVRGAGSWGDDVWHAGDGPTKGILCNVAPAADAAGAAYAYARDLGEEGSITVFLPRLDRDD
jgi:hypothetical protein